MQSKEKAQTYLALKQAKEMALQLLHRIAAYWFWQKKKRWPHWFWPLSLASSCFLLFSFSLLLCSAFFFLLFSFHSDGQNLWFSVFLSTRLWLFFCSFLSIFSLLFLLSFCYSLLSFLPLSQVIKGAYIQSNISLFRKDLMH